MPDSPRWLQSLGALAAVGAALAACEPAGATNAPEPVRAAALGPQTPPSRAEQIALGEKLVNTSGCHDCHTPFKLGANGPEPDWDFRLAGHPSAVVLPPAPPPAGPWLVSVSATNTAWSGPWGTTFTANLTPDPDTGLGKWSSDHFVQTIRTGRHLGRGRQLLPPMPIPVYQNFSDDELRAIFSYLQTIPAISNRVPEPVAPVASPDAPPKTQP